MDLLILIYLETEDHVVGVEGMAVGKVDTMAQFQCVVPSGGRGFPGFCQSRLGVLRVGTDVNQVRKEKGNHLFLRDVHGGDGIQCFWIRVQRDQKASAAPTGFSRRDEDVLIGLWRLERRRQSTERQ